VLVNAKIHGSSRDDRRRFLGDNRLYWTSQKTYGLGTGTAEEAAGDQKYDYFRFYETMYWAVSRHAYVGTGFLYSNHRDVRPADGEAEAAWPSSPYVTYSEQHGFDTESQTSAGLSLGALFDSRDGSINPSRGWYAKAAYGAFFDGFLGCGSPLTRATGSPSGCTGTSWSRARRPTSTFPPPAWTRTGAPAGATRGGASAASASCTARRSTAGR